MNSFETLETLRIIGVLLTRLGGKADIALQDLLNMEEGCIVSTINPLSLVQTFRVEGITPRPPGERVVTITRDAFINILDKRLEEAGIRITVRRCNSILTDMGFELDEPDGQIVSGKPETSQEVPQ